MFSLIQEDMDILDDEAGLKERHLVREVFVRVAL